MSPVARKTTFKEAFCQHYHCAPEAFAEKAILRAFPIHALPFALVFSKLKPLSWEHALDAIEQAAQAEDEHDLRRVMGNYRYHLRMAKTSAFVQALKLRISGKRLLALFVRVRAGQVPSGEPSLHGAVC